MHLFGLTGGIASGKSTVAARLRARGVPVIDADALAREVVLPGSDGLAAIVAAFGAGVLDEHGALDRKALGRLVFADASARKTLERITHPRIAALGAERAAALGAQGEPLAGYEAALLVENGLQVALRPLVVVACPEDLQVARAVARDGGTLEDARARIRAQLPLGDKVAAADVVVDSSGTIEETLARADLALAAVCAAAGVDARRYEPKGELG